MPIRPLADIIIYTNAPEDSTFGLLGATQEGLNYLKARYGSLAHGTTATINGTDEFLEAEFAAIDNMGLQTRMM